MTLALAAAQAVQALPAAAELETQSSAVGEWHVYGDCALADPLFLALIPVALAALWWGTRGRASGAVGSLAGAGAAGALPRTLRARALWVPTALKALALTLTALALARPLLGNVQQDRASEGVDIALAIDRSGSMRFDDLEPGTTRFDVVREVVGDFAERRMTDQQASADNVALVTFARYPELVCPFTLDAGALRGFLAGVKMVEREDEDGTAIGAGLAKCVALLRESDAASKVVVLLTDGENNVSEIAPSEAAELAAAERVRVYTVLAGRYVYEMNFFGQVVATEKELDTTDMRLIADTTGGKFFRARDKQALEEVYAEIERLEKTPRRERRWVETYDLYPWLLGPALALYALGWLCASTFARTAP